MATEVLTLIPHPQARPFSAITVKVEVTTTDRNDVLLEFAVHGGDEVLFPEWSSTERADELWKTTCFELFLKPQAQSAYFEFNFSPATKWAAYAFDDYRHGMRQLRLTVEPHLEFAPEKSHELSVDVDLSDIPDVPLKIGLAAVLEERDGTKSYWALAHPPGPPDFHHPDCFIGQLP